MDLGKVVGSSVECVTEGRIPVGVRVNNFQTYFLALTLHILLETIKAFITSWWYLNSPQNGRQYEHEILTRCNEVNYELIPGARDDKDYRGNFTINGENKEIVMSCM